jgi:hypothetical protein
MISFIAGQLLNMIVSPVDRHRPVACVFYFFRCEGTGKVTKEFGHFAAAATQRVSPIENRAARGDAGGPIGGGEPQEV